MKTIKLLCIVLLFLTGKISAQTYNITGKVQDKSQQVLEFANVVITNTDKSVQNGVVTDQNGTFSLENIKQGTYKLIVSFVGYKDYQKEIEVCKSLEIPTIMLNDDTEMLQIVEITGYKKLISNKKGKTTLKVAGTKLTSMPNTSTLMSFVPGVKSIGNDIEVLGKGKPLIFINGREFENTSQINSLKPEIIKNITVDRNPSAKYDAKYKSVIHIVTTKSKSSKNLQIQLGHASAMNSEYNHSEEIHVNHKSGKFTNYFFYKFKNKKENEDVTSYQKIFFNNQEQYNSAQNTIFNNEKLHTFTLGSNVAINNKNTLDIQYFYNGGSQDAEIIGNEVLSGVTNKKYDVFRSGESENKKHTLNLNYSLAINESNVLGLYGDYTYKKSLGFENVLNKSVDSQTKYDLENNSKFNTYALRVEYEKVFSNGLSLGVGTRFSEIKNDAQTTIKRDGKSNMDNKSNLKEQTFAVYTTLSKEFGNLSAEVGVRIERNKGTYDKNGISVFEKPRVFANVFPSLALNYMANEKLSFDFNYNSKITRSTFSELDPSISYINSFLYEQGNPSLKPTISHNFEVGTTINDNLNISLAYNLNKNEVVYLTKIDKNNGDLLIHKPLNLNKVSAFQTNISYSNRLGKLQTSLSANISYPFVEYPFMGGIKKITKVKYQFMISNVYLLSSNVILFSNFLAQSKHSYINSMIDPTYNLVMGTNFKLLKGKLWVTIFGNNLLNMNDSNSTSEYGYVLGGEKYKPDTRMIGIKLKYNINSFKNKFKVSDSNQEDLQRIE